MKSMKNRPSFIPVILATVHDACNNEVTHLIVPSSASCVRIYEPIDTITCNILQDSSQVSPVSKQLIHLKMAEIYKLIVTLTENL